MKHHLNSANLMILGMLFFATMLVFLFAVEPRFVGRAVTTTVNITNSTPASCSVEVGAGFNMISFSCITTAQPIGGLVNGSGVVAIYQYVPGSGDLWRVHNPNLPEYVVSDLQFLSRRAGYVAVMSEPAIFSHEGAVPASTLIGLVPGWNLVGYPSLVGRNASVSFASINDSLTEARWYNNTLGAYLVYPDQGGESLVVTVPGQGLWINTTQADTWVVTDT